MNIIIFYAGSIYERIFFCRCCRLVQITKNCERAKIMFLNVRMRKYNEIVTALAPRPFGRLEFSDFD